MNLLKRFKKHKVSRENDRGVKDVLRDIVRADCTSNISVRGSEINYDIAEEHDCENCYSRFCYRDHLYRNVENNEMMYG